MERILLVVGLCRLMCSPADGLSANYRIRNPSKSYLSGSKIWGRGGQNKSQGGRGQLSYALHSSPPPYPVRVAVMGGGNFGIALATICARKGMPTTLLVRSEEVAEEINTNHKHPVKMNDMTPEATERHCDDLAYRLAVYEAGHALTARALGLSILRIAMLPRPPMMESDKVMRGSMLSALTGVLENRVIELFLT